MTARSGYRMTIGRCLRSCLNIFLAIESCFIGSLLSILVIHSLREIGFGTSVRQCAKRIPLSLEQLFPPKWKICHRPMVQHHKMPSQTRLVVTHTHTHTPSDSQTELTLIIKRPLAHARKMVGHNKPVIQTSVSQLSCSRFPIESKIAHFQIWFPD